MIMMNKIIVDIQLGAAAGHGEASTSLPLGNLGGFLFAGTTCRLFTNPIVILGFPTSGQGTASITLPVPLSASGLTLFAQVAAFSQGANPQNLVLSGGGVVHIQ